ncbi:transposase [Paenibacillus mendelii]|uniref:Transposase n=1 Tax=Paenibacillus mendelii TaxID=206163 RepID=A0ABV6JCX0_9BACL|nr:transposase [Paenibacillus mendelii]MCQ6562487.1 transposase [Paenibacillus mendelii]
MSEKKRHYEMEPVSGETVEVDGVYKNEWGGEEKLKRGQTFPADVMLGSTEWELAELDFDNHHKGHTDPRLVPKAEDNANSGSKSPRGHVDRGDK